jgi:hypothetical protein
MWVLRELLGIFEVTIWRKSSQEYLRVVRFPMSYISRHREDSDVERAIVESGVQPELEVKG